MNQESPPVILPPKLGRIHKYIKALGQLQVFVGLCCVALGALSDFASAGENPAKVPLIVEFCGLYLIVTGFVGISGSSSYRRGLLTAFLVMSIHVAVICVPAIVATSAKAISDSSKDCYASCEMGLCKVVCGLEADSVPKGSMTAISSDIRVEVGLLGLAAIELVLSLACSLLCGLAVCESFGIVDQTMISQVHRITTLKAAPRNATIPSVSSEIQPDP